MFLEKIQCMLIVQFLSLNYYKASADVTMVIVIPFEPSRSVFRMFILLVQTLGMVGMDPHEPDLKVIRRN